MTWKSKVKIGDAYGKLLVLERVENNQRGQSQWLCQCECGNQVIRLGYKLTGGRSSSCGDRMHLRAIGVDWSNPEQVREYDRERNRTYGKENKEAIKLRKKRFRCENPEHSMLKQAKSRSKKTGMEVSIDLSDIIIPTHCPVFGIPLRMADEPLAAHSPSLDRLDSSSGYVKGNVWVISWKANALKGYSTLPELEAVVSALETVWNGLWLPSKPFTRHKPGQGKDPVTSLIKQARNRATKTGREFSLEHSDLIMPDVCPILGIPLFKVGGKSTDNSPSIDRIDSSKGYVKGNVWVTSWRANEIKRDGTLDEFRALIKAWRAKLEELRLLKNG